MVAGGRDRGSSAGGRFIRGLRRGRPGGMLRRGARTRADYRNAADDREHGGRRGPQPNRSTAPARLAYGGQNVDGWGQRRLRYVS